MSAPRRAYEFDWERPDIHGRDDVRRLVVGFYRAVAMDDVLGPIFAAAHVDWSEHHDKLTDFWAWQVLGHRTYERNPLLAHRAVHARTPLADEHYERWLELFETTVDDLFGGPTADTAKRRAHAMAKAMRRLLAGQPAAADSPIQVTCRRQQVPTLDPDGPLPPRDDHADQSRAHCRVGPDPTVGSAG